MKPLFSYMSVFLLPSSLTHVHVPSLDVFVHLPCLLKVEGCNPIVSLYVTMSYVVTCTHMCVHVGVSVVGSTHVLGVLRVPSTHPHIDPLS